MAFRRSIGLVGVLVAIVIAVVLAAPDGARIVAVAAPSPTTIATSSASTALDNPFLPEDRNLSDCVSALPQPDCGSAARGGWRQTLVFGVIVLGLGIIAWRLVAGARRARLRA